MSINIVVDTLQQSLEAMVAYFGLMCGSLNIAALLHPTRLKDTKEQDGDRARRINWKLYWIELSVHI